MASVSHHYATEGFARRVRDRLAAAGLGQGALDPDRLATLDEFHLGGRLATEALLEAVAPLPEAPRILDVGCGIGGPARRLAQSTEGEVLGVDLTPAYVEMARELTERAGLADRCRFELGSALSLPVPAESFDLVTLIHVGMNVEDKAGLMAELGRVVAPGGVVAVYDVMRTGPGQLSYPMPWATTPETSHVDTVDVYAELLLRAGLEVAPPIAMRELAQAALERQQAERPRLSLSDLMGPRFPEMIGHLQAALQAGVVAPVLLVARPAGRD